MKALILSVVFALFAAYPALADKSVLLVTNEYAPYVTGVERRPGFFYEVVVAAFERVGVKADIQFRPWRRCAMLVEEGVAFGAFPYAKTRERSEYANFSDSIGECRNVFFYLRGRLGDFDYTGLADLRRFSIAGTSGNYYEEIFKRARLRVDYAPGEASGVRKVWEMRTDLFAEDEMVGWTLINRIFPSNKKMFGSTPTPWNINQQHIMVSVRYPGSRKLMERFNRGLKAIREDGTYRLIYERYMTK